MKRRTLQRIAKKRKIFPGISEILFILLIPYLITITVNGAETALINRKFQTEMILPAIVASQISEDYEPETVKAQSILARSNFYRKRKDGKNLQELLREVREQLQRAYKQLHLFPEVYEKAVAETEDVVLTWDKELKLVPYHEVSAGRTRDGLETLKNEADTYLKSVESPADKEAPNYINSTYVKARQLPERFVISRRDSVGYVTELLADGKRLEGEAFRLGMGLSSANFSIQRIGDEIRFLCKGKGHGLGFSQYGGNALAKEGYSCEEILATYFPGMELMEIGDVYMK